MSERPVFESRKPRDRPLTAERPGGARNDHAGTTADDSRSVNKSDAIWDPEIKDTNEAERDKLLARLPQRETRAQSIAPIKIENPTPRLRQIPHSPALSDTTFLPPLPKRSSNRSKSGLFWFVVCVLLPIVMSAIYYGRIASNQYVAEFRFTVKDATLQASNSAASNGLLAILGTASNSSNNSYVVVDYLKSRQVVDELQQRIDITQLYSKRSIDWWSRYDSSKPIESFVNYWRGIITANYDQITGIATAKVRAFSPDEALLVANALVTLSEELVNQIANRSHSDAVRFAQAEVDKAEQRLKRVRERLTDYRNRTGLIDPNTSVVASAANLIQSLRATLAQQEAQLATMLRQNLLPTAPNVIVLRNQIQSTREQLKRVEGSVEKSVEGRPLSTVMGDYEQLDLERQFSQTMLTGALQALDQARANAAAQHLYITPFVRPSMPTTSTYPNRFLSVLYVGAMAFVFWLIALLIIRSIRERFA